MGLKNRLGFCVVTGFVVGALSASIEAVVLMVRIPWRSLEISTLPVAMVIYGFSNGVFVSLWGWLTRKMDEKVFQVKTIIFATFVMIHGVGGFYINTLWFPEIYAPASLLFTGAWTIAWLIAVGILLRFRPRRTLSDSLQRAIKRIGSITTLLLVLLAGFSFMTPHLYSGVVRAQSVEEGQPNLLMIVMDTTRADHLSCYGYPRETTPHLDRIAEKGILFEQVSAVAPWTVPSHASLFTGLYPSQHGTGWDHPRLDDRFTTLAELLREHGYQTVGFSNNPWLSRATNFQQGFEYFEESWEGGRLMNRLALIRIVDKLVELAARSRDDDADLTNRDIRRWFDQVYDSRHPFFLFINYIEPHFVYEPPEPYRSHFLQAVNRPLAATLKLGSLRLLAPPVDFDAKEKLFLTDLYDGEIAYLDMRVGELMEDLRRRQILDRTVVVITSDHGENIGDHRIFQHQFSLHETLLHVPLIIRYPKLFHEGKRIKEPVSSIHVMPTILDLLQLEMPTELKSLIPGTNLFRLTSQSNDAQFELAEYGAPIVSLPRYQQRYQAIDERYFRRNLKSLRNGKYKFIWASDGEHEFYDLSQDPNELHNRIGELPEQANAMKAELEKRLLTLKPVGIQESAPELDEAVRGKLRSLGYLH